MKRIAIQIGRVSIGLMLTCLVFSSTRAQGLSQFKKSFKLIENVKGTQCESSSSILLKFKNTTAETMDFQYAIQDENGTWQTGFISAVEQGKDTGNISACKSNGRFKWWARPSSKALEYKFPNKSDLNE